MSDRVIKWPWAIYLIILMLLLCAAGLSLVNDAFGAFIPIAILMVIGYGTIGTFLACRFPGNPIGWLMMVIAGAFTMSGLTEEATTYGALTQPGGLPALSAFAWVSYLMGFFIFGSFVGILLLFPTGRVSSPRWRIALVALVIDGAILVLVTILKAGTLEMEHASYRNPTGVEALTPALKLMEPIALAVLAVLAITAFASLVVRYRHAADEERRQIRFVAWAFAVGLGLMAVVFVTWSLPTLNSIAFYGLFGSLGLGVPLAIGYAIVRHRLYDIDVVVKKTVVFAIVVVMLVAVGGLIAVLVGVGLVPQLYDTPPLFLFFGLVCGLLAAPVYRLASRIADRLVYGGRASPSEVLSEFSGRLSETYATDDVLPRMASILGEATRAKEVRVWLRVERAYRVAASWPRGADAAAWVEARGDHLPVFPGDDHRTEVRDRGDLLGAITATFHANDPIDEGRERLIRDMAAQAGLVLRNVRLIENLRASRQRMVAAQDEGRRRLERNIHDGAQQQLVALSVKTRLADGMIDRDTAEAHEMLGQIQADANDALETLRDLARGIYPPLLADKGLATALEAQGRKATIPVTLDAEDIDRYPAETEATVYFCVLEALQNIAKYADASTIHVQLRAAPRALNFTVRDDGVGFDPESYTPGTGIQGMQDRLDAVGGSLTVTSAVGDGTLVAGSVPISQ